eukprot:CAMPEP_0204564450 /NCGR_PEP_ID=MMETSP0661-20131031/34891_1 /ASSEMBLY_ACC=CAM_ASM_000606 /TAXON_ID=109239 /ORGANISM="Alexandrium margalefi, Strain AMGDE01CS-322" /LENGTH=457 /DNA_ID=CAMNT_0051572093 /DNA_START=55 /DNA_END=1428 /DNA_ORIENTATION=+
MRRSQLFLVGAFAAARCASASHPKAVTEDADPYLPAFEDFVRRFGKTYSDAERPRRFAAFRANLDIIESRNSQNNSYKLGITAFADLTPEEFAAAYGAPAPVRPRLTAAAGLPFLGVDPVRNLSLPESVDWRTKGAVASIKQQGQCGACWAFAGAAAIEGAWQIATGQLVSLSEQQIVDCSGKLGTDGCKGGSIEAGIQYSTQTKLTNEASYPYQMKVGTCKEDNAMVMIPKGGVVGYKHVTSGSEQGLLEAVAQQPVAVAMDADSTLFALYKGGILSKDCGDKINHAIVVIGYGTDKGQDYWLVRNSWGDEWGEGGYGRLARGKGVEGECGITATPPVMAVVDGSKAKPIDVGATLIAAAVAAGGRAALAALLLRPVALPQELAEGTASARPGQAAEPGRAGAAAAAPRAAAPQATTSSDGQRLGGAKGTTPLNNRLLQQFASQPGAQPAAAASQV